MTLRVHLAFICIIQYQGLHIIICIQINRSVCIFEFVKKWRHEQDSNVCWNMISKHHWHKVDFKQIHIKSVLWKFIFPRLHFEKWRLLLQTWYSSGNSNRFQNRPASAYLFFELHHLSEEEHFYHSETYFKSIDNNAITFILSNSVAISPDTNQKSV